MESENTKKQRNQEEMFSFVKFWKESGLSQQEFCKSNNLPYNTFQYWYRKYNLSHGSTHASDFIALKSVSKLNSAEIIFPSGARLVLHSLDPSFIKSLLM